MGKTIEQLIAEDAIKNVQMRYCRGSDRCDIELLRSCFHPDATTDYGYFGGTVEEFLAVAQTVLPTYIATTHNTGNQNIVVNGNTAWAEHYTVATHRMPADDKGPLRDFITAVRYVDRLECREGEWRITRRVLILDWSRTDPVGTVTAESTIRTGKMGKDDPSYALL